MFKTLRKVLVVDDAEDQRLRLQSLLLNQGLEVVMAEDGRQAIEALKKQDFNLMMTDLEMPHLDGMQLIEWCRSHALHIPIVLLSSNFRPLRDRKFMHLDCCSLLVKKKPIDFHLLMTVIRAADLHEHDEHCIFKSFKDAMDEYLGNRSHVDP